MNFLSLFLTHLGTILAVITFLSGLISAIYRFSKRPRKEVTCTEISRYPLVEHAKKVSNLEIKFDGKPITNAFIVEIDICNSGNVDIPSKDFETDITLQLNESAILLDLEIIDAQPPELLTPSIIKATPSKVILHPLLLNKKDRIKFKLLVNNYEDYEISGRIIGIKHIRKESISKMFTVSEKRFSYLGDRATFWLAVASVAAFVGGNILGQQGWRAFLKIIIGE